MFEISDSSEIKGQLNFLKDFKPLTEILTVPYIYLFIQNEIKRLYEDIEETDNKIKDRKQQIKNMEIKIREVQEASNNVFSAIRYLTFTHNNSIANRIKRMFKKEQLKLNA